MPHASMPGKGNRRRSRDHRRYGADVRRARSDHRKQRENVRISADVVDRHRRRGHSGAPRNRRHDDLDVRPVLAPVGSIEAELAEDGVETELLIWTYGHVLLCDGYVPVAGLVETDAHHASAAANLVEYEQPAAAACRVERLIEAVELERLLRRRGTTDGVGERGL